MSFGSHTGQFANVEVVTTLTQWAFSISYTDHAVWLAVRKDQAGSPVVISASLASDTGASPCAALGGAEP
jgi:hypothetical protein